MRYAWLEFHRHRWHLLTDDEDDPVRTWADRDSALSQLAEEGWQIEGPYPQKHEAAGSPGAGFHGYALTRTLH